MSASDDLNVWISVAQLPPNPSFPWSPWEHLHRCDSLLLHDLPSPPHCSPIVHLPAPVRPPLKSFQLNAVPEGVLVSRCMYALQGIPVAVAELELIAKAFSQQAADRSVHTLPTLWQRSASTNAVGKLLAVMAHAGRVRCQLEEFVDFFLRGERQGDAVDFRTHASFRLQGPRQKKKGRAKSKKLPSAVPSHEAELNLSPPFSLVNQAFAAAVKSVLQGHLAALNTLTNSVLHRRSMESQISSEEPALSDEHIGPVIGLGCEATTLLELHLHTSELRLQLQVLGSLCLYDTNKNDAVARYRPIEEDLDVPLDNPRSDFRHFPRGADLLTYLHNQLKEADLLHLELVRYLFSRACQPYLVFIQSWLYCATVKDPYKEFFVDVTTHVSSLHVRNSVSVPCFLKEICTPLLRAGQQLQVLLKLAEIGDFAEVIHRFSRGLEVSAVRVGLGMLEDALKCWTNFSSEKSDFALALAFNKEKMEQLIKRRERTRHELMEKFDLLFARHNLQSQGGVSSLERMNSHDLQQPNVLKAVFVTNDADSVECGTGHDTLFTVFDGKNGDRPATGLSKQDGDTAESQNICLVEEISTNTKSFSGFEGGIWGQNYQGLEKNVYRVDDLTNGQSTEEKPASDNRLEKEIFQRASAISPFSGMNVPGSTGKQRQRWKEPHEVVIVHGKSEEDIGSIQNANDEDRGQESCYVVPSVADHERKTDSPYKDLTLGPDRDCCSVCDVASYKRLPCFVEVDCSWDIVSNAQNGGLQFFSVEPSKSFMNQYGTHCFSSSELSLEEIGPEHFFARSQIRRLGQKYAGMSQSSSYMKCVPSFDVVSQKFWSLEACISNTSSNLQVLPVFTSLNIMEKLDLHNFNDNLHCPAAVQNLCYRNIEQQPNHQHGSRNLSRATYISHYTSPTAGFYGLTGAHTHDPEVENAAEESLSAVDLEKQSEKSHGGGTWEIYLKEIQEQESLELGEGAVDSEDKLETPLEVVVDKCIVQEVLSQYNCISYFTVRLLLEIFGLQDHLSALRRYFFMDRGDWAENFASALYQHVWYPAGPQQRLVEVQGILETALQNSSCEDDEYADKLRVYIEGCERMEAEYSPVAKDEVGHTYVNKNCVTAFDFIMLKYKVEWPISLILTSESFKLYNSIFSFLLRAKLTIHALGDLWRCLKGFSQSSKRNTSVKIDQDKQERICTLMLLRQHIAHFTTTLQDYVESQLLYDVSSRFMHAIYDEAKDLQDLEAIHGAYLRDALHRCFLSDEMGPVKACIDEIMQCLLNLRSCLFYSGEQGEDGQFDITSDRVYSVVLEVKTQYEKSIKQLHHLRSASHNQTSLSYFWMRLDFNGFLADSCSRSSLESS